MTTEQAAQRGDGPVVVAILYPKEWYLSEEGFATEVKALEAMDPRVEVVVCPYEEGHDVRTVRSAGHPWPEGAQRPEIAPELAEVFSRMEVCLAIDLPEDITGRAPRLRWVQAVGAGTGQMGVDRLGAAGVTLTNNGGANGVAIAEFVMGRIIAWAKHFDALAEAQRRHEWVPRYGLELAGKTIGLIGYGGINRRVAARAAAFEMEVHVLRHSEGLTPEPPVTRYYGPAQLHQLLGASDIVVAAVPETDATKGIFDEAAFAAMRPGSFFVNVGRGSLVDTAALLGALSSGHLAGAALDVAPLEPLPADHPLWDAPNLALSPHCSSSPPALFPNVHKVLRDNLRRYLDGEPLHHVVRPGRGY